MDYFDKSQHRFMSAVTDTLIDCKWDENNARLIECEVLEIWEYSHAVSVKANLSYLTSLLTDIPN